MSRTTATSAPAGITWPPSAAVTDWSCSSTANSPPLPPRSIRPHYDLTTRSPLRIGFGEVDYFSGKIREVRLYRRTVGRR